MGWVGVMEWVGVGVCSKINQHSVNLTRARMPQDRRKTYREGNHTPERSKPLHGACTAINGGCGLGATGVVFIPQSALQMGNSVAKMSQVCLVNWISVNPPFNRARGAA